MRQSKLNMRTIVKIFLFGYSFSGIGIVLALFWGIGWFFLLVTLRRLMIFYPPLNRKLQEIMLGKKEIITPQIPLPDSKLVVFSEITRLIIMIPWIGMTIFAFYKLNFPLIDIFNR